MRSEVPEGWRRVRLGTVAEVRSGVTKNTKKQLSDPIEVPYLRVANVQDGYLDLDEMKVIGIERRDLPRFRLNAGDVVMNEGGDIDKLGRGAVWNGQIDPCVHQNHVFSVRCRTDSLIPAFLAAAAESQIGKTYFMEVGKQTTNLACINKTLLREFPLFLPPLPEQKKIAAVLSTVDEAIQATQAVIEQTRKVKEGLLQELLTRGIGHTRFKQSPLGKIPGGWAVRRLGTCLRAIEAGWSPSCPDQIPAPGTWGVLKVSAVTGGVFKPQESKQLPQEMDPRPAVEVCEGDVLCVRANGNPDLVGVTVRVPVAPRARLMLSDKTLRLVPVPAALDRGFLAHAMSSEAIRGQVQESFSGSSGQKNISQSTIRSLRVALPPLAEQLRITAILTGADSSASEAEKRVRQLQQVKAGLLQDLLTGKVRVNP